jgi:hypothetical protein
MRFFEKSWVQAITAIVIIFTAMIALYFLMLGLTLLN